MQRYNKILEHTVYDKRPCIKFGRFMKLPLGVNAKDGYAIIDKCYSYLDQYYWSKASNGYAQARIDDKTTILHKYIMGKTGIVDHKNNDRLDNRKSNLRICTASQNVGNMTMPAINTSGFKGVHRLIKNKKWCAVIGYKYIGSFIDIKDAALAYNNEAIKKWGEFAKLNEIGD